MKQAKWVCLWVLPGLILVACGGTNVAPNEENNAAASNNNISDTDETSTEPVVLRVGAPDDDYILDEADAGRVTVGMSQINTGIFDTLTQMGPDFQITPILADYW